MSKRGATKRKAKRRPRGTGQLYFDERRRLWVGRVPLVGKRTKTGRLCYREVTAPTQAEVLSRMRSVGPPGESTTVAEWAQRWLDSSSVRDSTRDTYGFTVKNYIVPTLGTIRLTALTTAHCDAAVRQWLQRAMPGTVRVYLGQLRNLLNAAKRADAIPVNPATAVRTPKATRRPDVEFPPGELLAILNAALERTTTLPVALLAATGCRVGECLALDVGDWDAKKGMIAITKTWSRRHGTRPPKSEEGLRTIRVPVAARPALTAAVGSRKSGPIFLTWSGGRRMYHEGVRMSFRRLLKKLGLAMRTLHTLRAMVASSLNANGTPIADAARYLGHTPEVYVSTYLRPTGADPSAVMDDVFKPARGRKRG
jgi:integrase